MTDQNSDLKVTSPTQRRDNPSPLLPSSPVVAAETQASSDPEAGAGEVLLLPAPAVNVGGPSTHKPGCRCRPCTARRRQEKADADGSGPKVLTVGLPKYDQRRIIADYIAATAANPDASQRQLAEKIGVGTRTLDKAIKSAVREGWLKFEDPLETLQHDIIPHATRNLQYLMKKKDKFATLETMKHTVFKDYQNQNAPLQDNQTVLAIKIEGVQPQHEVKVVAGQVIGKGRQIED